MKTRKKPTTKNKLGTRKKSSRAHYEPARARDSIDLSLRITTRLSVGVGLMKKWLLRLLLALLVLSLNGDTPRDKESLGEKCLGVCVKK